MERLDLDRLLERVDIDAIVERTDLGTIVSRSGSAVMIRAIDGMRAQGIGLDSALHGWIDRLLRRGASDGQDVPPRPGPSVERSRVTAIEAAASLRNDLYGRSAGVATRLFAFLVDLFTILLLFTVGGHVVSFVLSIVLGNDVAALRGATRLLDRSPAVGVHVLRLPHFGVRLHPRHGRVRDTGRSPRWWADRHSPRGGTSAGIPAELRRLLPGLRAHRAPPGPTCPPRPHCQHRRHLRRGRRARRTWGS